MGHKSSSKTDELKFTFLCSCLFVTG